MAIFKLGLIESKYLKGLINMINIRDLFDFLNFYDSLTNPIVFESAFYDPTAAKKTSQQHGKPHYSFQKKDADGLLNLYL